MTALEAKVLMIQARGVISIDSILQDIVYPAIRKAAEQGDGSVEVSLDPWSKTHVDRVDACLTADEYRIHRHSGYKYTSITISWN